MRQLPSVILFCPPLAENGHVFLRGLYQATHGNLQNNTLLGIVPGNLRPSYTLSFPAIARTTAER